MDFSSQVEAQYINNRQTGQWQQHQKSYDADGRPLGSRIDAAGKPVEQISTDVVGGYPNYPTQPSYEIRQKFDGGGEVGWREEIGRQDVTEGGQTTVQTTTAVTYTVRSTVLGGKSIVELEGNGTKRIGNVYANGALLAQHRPNSICQGCLQNTQINEANPLTGSGSKVDGYGGAYQEERDPLGAIMGTEDPWLYAEEPSYPDLLTNQQPMYLEANPWNPSEGCALNGMAWDCNDLARQADHGSVVAGEYRGGRYHAQHTIGGISFIGGSMSVFLPGSNDAPTPPGGNPETSYGTYDRWETFYMAAPDIKYSIAGFTKDQADVIKNTVNNMWTEACSKAFKDAGLKTIPEMLQGGGINFVHEGLLGSSTNNSQWNGDEEMREGLLAPYKQLINGNTAVKAYKGSYYVSLGNRAFTGWDNTAVHIIIHELIHAGGAYASRAKITDVYVIPPLPPITRMPVVVTRKRDPVHDLEWMGEKYETIIKACTPQN